MKTSVLVIGLSALLLTGCIHGHHGNWDRSDRDGYTERDRDDRRYERDNRYDNRYNDKRWDSWRNRESR
ncbi:hypothetical protein ACM5Q9_11595 [Advenella sp. RU8]|uniref:hypothetical protein n=1 Tax=Advenella sp. RU8 TaxID=3399575 RepID=UPI003AAA5F13